MEKNIYTDLIYKSLESTLSDAEQENLNQWIKTSEEHRREYELIIESWQLSEDYHPAIKVDLEKDFMEVEKKIASSNPNFQKPSIRFKYLLRYAAIGLLFIGTGTILYFFSRSNQPIQVQEIVFSETQNFKLPDQSSITIRAGSKLIYPSKFEKDVREVSLDGEAFFDIVKDKKPFIINVPEGKIEVLGTAFNIKSTEDHILVRVKEGSVRFSIEDGSSEILVPGQSLQYNRKSQKIFLSENRIENVNSWIDDKLIFASTPLGVAAQDLNVHFNVRIQIQSDEVKECPFTSTFEKTSISKILETIQVVFQIDEIVHTDSTIQIYGGRCPER